MKRDSPILSIRDMERIIVRMCFQQILMTALSESTFQDMQSSTGVCNENNANTDKAVKLVSEIALKMSSANDIVFHYDKSTSIMVDSICAQGLRKSTSNEKNVSNIQRTNKFHYSALNVVYILNCYEKEHRINNSLADFKPSRNILHVVILPDPLFFTDRYKDIIKSDHMILYICVNQTQNVGSCRNQFKNSKSNFENPSMFLNTILVKNIYLVLVLEFSDELVKLFEICFYCGKESQKITLRYVSKLKDENYVKTSNLINEIMKKVEYNFKDFNSHGLRVAFPHDYVYVGCINEVNTDVGDEVFTECSDFTGVQAIMLREMSKRLNFKYALVNPKKHAEEGTWKNMVTDVYEKKADFAITISVSEARLKIVDFSDTVGDDPLRVYYMSRPNVLSEALMIVLVFKFPTWGALIATMSFLSCLIYISDRYCYTNHLALFRSFWMVGCILVEQGIGSGSRMPGRCILGSWLLCTIILCTVYKGKLTSDMVNPPSEHLANLHEMGELGYHVYVHEFDGSFVVDALKKSPDPVLQEMSKRTHRNLSICKVLRKALNTDIVLIEEQILVENAVNNKCPEIISNEDLTKIRVTNDLNYFPSNQAWPFSKNTPYIGAINYYISLFYQNGLQAKWSESLYASSGKNNIHFDKGIVKVDSSQTPIKLYGPLLMWAFGIFISIVCFLSEICHSLCITSKRIVTFRRLLHK